VRPVPPRFAANVAWLFTELPWHDRFGAAREAGFAAVELPWPDDPAGTARAARDAGVRVAMLNAPAGDLAAGERGWPNDPSRVGEWRDAFAAALELAADAACPTINVLAGNRVPHASDGEQLACLEANLRWALDAVTPAGIGIVTELVNRRENPGYLLATLADAAPLLDRLGSLRWRLQLDTYHVGLTEPEVAAAIRRAGAYVGHVQVADVPERHEPGSGVLDWAAIAAALRDIGYGGFIGLEYRPTGGTDWIGASPLSEG